MRSIDLSKLVGIKHSHMLRSIKDDIEKYMWSSENVFLTEYSSSQNKNLPCYEMSSDYVRHLIVSNRFMTNSPERVRISAEILASLNLSESIVVKEKTRDELEFSQTLRKFIGGRFEIIEQHSICGYRIDFYLPDVYIAIEYDEKFHRTRKDKDQKREDKITNYSNETSGYHIDFIRVTQGKEIESLWNICSLIKIKSDLLSLE